MGCEGGGYTPRPQGKGPGRAGQAGPQGGGGGRLHTQGGGHREGRGHCLESCGDTKKTARTRRTRLARNLR